MYAWGDVLRDGGGNAACSRSSLDGSDRGACQMSRPGGLPRGSAGQPAPPNVLVGYTRGRKRAAWTGVRGCDTQCHSVSHRCPSVSCAFDVCVVERARAQSGNPEFCEPADMNRRRRRARGTRGTARTRTSSPAAPGRCPRRSAGSGPIIYGRYTLADVSTSHIYKP